MRGRGKYKGSPLRSAPRKVEAVIYEDIDLNKRLAQTNAREIWISLGDDMSPLERKMNFNHLSASIGQDKNLLSRMLLGTGRIPAKLPAWLDNPSSSLTEEQREFLLQVFLQDPSPQIKLRRKILESFVPSDCYDEEEQFHPDFFKALSYYNQLIEPTNKRAAWSHQFYRKLLSYKNNWPHPTGLLELLTSYKELIERLDPAEGVQTTKQMWDFLDSFYRANFRTDNDGWHYSARGAFYQLILAGKDHYQWEDKPKGHSFDWQIDRIKRMFKEQFNDRYLPINDLAQKNSRISGRQLHKALMLLHGRQNSK